MIKWVICISRVLISSQCLHDVPGLSITKAICLETGFLTWKQVDKFFTRMPTYLSEISNYFYKHISNFCFDCSSTILVTSLVLHLIAHTVFLCHCCMTFHLSHSLFLASRLSKCFSLTLFFKWDCEVCELKQGVILLLELSWNKEEMGNYKSRPTQTCTGN